MELDAAAAVLAGLALLGLCFLKFFAHVPDHNVMLVRFWLPAAAYVLTILWSGYRIERAR